MLGEVGRKRKRGDQAKLAPRRAFIPSPTGHQGSTNNWRLSKGVLRVARSLGVATACSPPSPVRGRVVGPYLGLGQTFQGLHNGLFRPRGLGLQREGRKSNLRVGSEQ